MTLEDLVEQIDVQGPVRVSRWDAEGTEEAVLWEGLAEDGFEDRDATADPPRWYCQSEVKYMFVGGDMVLHVELEREDRL